jgi:hypothetical protein
MLVLSLPVRLRGLPLVFYIGPCLDSLGNFEKTIFGIFWLIIYGFFTGRTGANLSL